MRADINLRHDGPKAVIKLNGHFSKQTRQPKFSCGRIDELMTCVRPADVRQLRWNNRLWMARTSASGDHGRGSPSFQFDDNKLRRFCVAGIPPLMHNVRLKAQNLTRSRGPHTLALDLRRNGALHDKDNFQAIQMSMTLVHTTWRV